MKKETVSCTEIPFRENIWKWIHVSEHKFINVWILRNVQVSKKIILYVLRRNWRSVERTLNVFHKINYALVIFDFSQRSGLFRWFASHWPVRSDAGWHHWHATPNDKQKMVTHQKCVSVSKGEKGTKNMLINLQPKMKSAKPRKISHSMQNFQTQVRK